MKRLITVISTSRADFSLLMPVVEAIKKHELFRVEMVILRSRDKKFQERKFCEALNIFNNLIKLNPNDGDLLFTLGNIYYSLN